MFLRIWLQLRVRNRGPQIVSKIFEIRNILDFSKAFFRFYAFLVAALFVVINFDLFISGLVYAPGSLKWEPIVFVGLLFSSLLLSLAIATPTFILDYISYSNILHNIYRRFVWYFFTAIIVIVFVGHAPKWFVQICSRCGEWSADCRVFSSLILGPLIVYAFIYLSASLKIPAR